MRSLAHLKNHSFMIRYPAITYYWTSLLILLFFYRFCEQVSYIKCEVSYIKCEVSYIKCK